jgi:hypothetical protein
MGMMKARVMREATGVTEVTGARKRRTGKKDDAEHRRYCEIPHWSVELP